MVRSVDEWIGKNDDETPPPRVRLRVFDRYEGRCHLCTRKISAGEYWQADHVAAIINGGPNRESNLRPACRNCCYSKTGDDVAEKSKVATVSKKHRLPKERGRGWPKAPPGYSAWTRRIEQ